MPIKVHNVLSGQKEDFVPQRENEVRMYVCGPTVQDYSHVGHAKTYIAFDVIVRYLRYAGYAVRYVQNITDVGHLLDSGEDRILKKAGQLGTEPMEVVEHYMRNYFEDMDALGILRPDISPRATGHIPEQIEIISMLITKGHAYQAGSDVYFDVGSFSEYGKLSRRKIDQQEEGVRVEVESNKRHPNDFALWKHTHGDAKMQWRSPWGWGYPGWHIECTAMANKYLGRTLDIHGGGIDNIFPHNECEIAQSEAAFSQTFAKYWLLTGSLTVDGVKMSKSLGNFTTVKDVLSRYPAEAIRTFVLMGHYSNPVDFSETAIGAAQSGWERLVGAARLTRERMRSAPQSDGVKFDNAITEHKTRVLEALDDDFKTPLAISALQDFTREVNTLLNGSDEVGLTTLGAIDAFYREIGGQVLGIIPDTLESGGSAQREDGLIRLLLSIRDDYRAEKQFEKSDQIRDALAELGINVEDRTDGSLYHTS